MLIKAKNLLKQILVFLGSAFFVNSSFGQASVGIGTTTPNASAALEITSPGNNKGVLIPRVALTAVGDITTIAAPAHGLLVFLTINDANIIEFPLGEGFYYNQGLPDKGNWIKILDEITNNAAAGWLLAGNFIDNPNQFIGTTNSANVIFKRNNEEVAQFYPGGAVVFTGNTTKGFTPLNGAGRRMMWIPEEGAFRAGSITGKQWDKDSIGQYSFATGFNTKAKGDGSTAMGYSTTASGAASTAMGRETTAFGENSIAMGLFTVASGNESTAMGANTVASEPRSTAMGFLTIASGENSTAMGGNTVASGMNSIAMGIVSQATGYASTAMGASSLASGRYSTATGSRTKALAYGSFVAGVNNEPTMAEPDPENPALTDRIFEIGNALNSDPISAKNAFTVLRNGKVSIGTRSMGKGPDPNSKLHIFGKVDGINNFNWDEFIALEGYDGKGKAAIRTTENLLTKAMEFKVFDAGYGFNFINENNTKIVRISSTGNMTITGMYNPSDIRLKTGIEPLSNILNKLNNVQPISYYFKDKLAHPAGHQIGLNAQEIEKEFPELVQKNEEGYLAVNYPQMAAVAIQAIKEQQELIKNLQVNLQSEKNSNDNQQKLVKKLSEENADIKKRIEQLEKLISNK